MNPVTKKICTEEDKIKKDEETFTPREYQIEIFETAKEKNTIACLGTGTGKTFIAVLLIREFANDVRIPFEEGGKRIFFLAPTVPLVHQQKCTIEHHTDLKVKDYSGDQNVDSWNAEKWTLEFMQNQVLVMTAEIFRIILHHKFILINQINLIIIDECHRAQGDHPYRQAMQCFCNVDRQQMPRIFGLSASLINGKCKPTQLGKQISALEKTLFSSITTASDIADLQKYGADPEEYLVYYKPYVTESELLSKVEEFRKRIADEKKSFGKLNEYVSEADLIFFDKPSHCLNALGTTLSKLGPWCALRAAEVYSEELTSVLIKSASMMLPHKQQEILKDLQNFLLSFIKECKNLNLKFTRDCVNEWPHKLKRLLEIFLAIKHSEKFSFESKIPRWEMPDFSNDPEKYCQILKANEISNNSGVQMCAIIFVEQRITAYILQQWIIELKSIYPEIDFLKPEFVVGHGTSGVKKTSMSEKQQKKALGDFRKRKCNILVSTSVLEEGMDVQQCNVVVRFDLPFDFRAYVQSKGRARAKNSVYVMMVEIGKTATDFLADMLNFKSVEKVLLNKCHDRPEPKEDDIEAHWVDSYHPYMPYGPDGPRITLVSAISLINRYCAGLPSDMATKLTAQWSVKYIDNDTNSKEYQCTLKMPINSPLRMPIIGEITTRKKHAKMTAALKACQLLHEIGELNKNLVPISTLVEKAMEEEMGIIEEEDCEGAIPGTKRRRQIYNKHVPMFMQNSLPVPLCESYLHVLKMELVEPLPDVLNPHSRPIINPANSTQGLALILSKKLPLVNPFPIFTKSGKLMVTVKLCEVPYFLSTEEVNAVTDFHQFLFAEALHLHRDKKFDPAISKAQYYIVPVHKNDLCKWTIDWKFIHNVKNHPYNVLKLNTSDPSSRLIFQDSLFKDAVLLRSYKVKDWSSERPTFHHVKRVVHGLSPESFVDEKEKKTFVFYYKSKYDLDILDKSQPLIETYQDPIIHKWKPLYTSVKQCFEDAPIKGSTWSNTKKKRVSYSEYLLPELSLVHPFPSSFFHQVMCIPTILFRLHCLLLAEELRQKLAVSGLFALASPSESLHWPDFNLETSDKDLKQHLFQSGKVVSPPVRNFVPSDIIKEGHKIVSFETKVDLSYHLGPSPSLVLQALTSKSAGDEFDLERLEMIGDSFLKYAMSIKCYIKYQNFDEGKLTKLRSQLIKNVHLYQCAKKKKIPEYLVCSKFCCNSTWLPPCYAVEEEKIEISNIKSKDNDPEDKLLNYFFQKQVISDKCIADSVEALIGAYLLTCGQKGALMFMSWLGLKPLPDKNDSDVRRVEDFETWPPKPPNPVLVPIEQALDVESRIQHLLSSHGFKRFEQKINYEFKNKAFLLQAFTHPSYSFNEYTDCYQRLEFLGDAVLDFLITRQLYEDPNEHTPGQLTDLRSALVNNIYFASLAVKYEYNKYLQICSPQLFRLLENFIKIYEKSELYKFFEEFGYLEEIECFELDEVEVPKALGDLFESVAGAIYLDSGMSLDAVWKVYYPMIAPALNHLTKHVPMSPIRELHEVLKAKDIFTFNFYKEKCYAKVTLPNGDEVVGVGPNKKVAKRSAAKRALAKLKKD